MSNREKLLAIANRFNAWFSSHDTNPSVLEAIVSRQVVLHIPFPGLSPDFDGLVEQYKRTIAATKDVQVNVKADVVDEDNSLVAQFFEATGTHTGEWVGIPATGKSYKIAGLGIVKIDLESGLITEYWSIIQDLSLLIQLGAISLPGGGS